MLNERKSKQSKQKVTKTYRNGHKTDYRKTKADGIKLTQGNKKFVKHSRTSIYYLAILSNEMYSHFRQYSSYSSQGSYNLRLLLSIVSSPA